MRFLPPLLLTACGTTIYEGDTCHNGGDTTHSDGTDYICQCTEASAPTGPCNLDCP
ncbi:MAG: hypothetical protein ACJAZO_002287 [Myxococcota bacterium]|jgi:hypothetical protein